VAHYGPSFSLTPPGGLPTNYFPQLNYFRFGGSVGSEWYPYCVTGTNTSGSAVGLVTLLPSAYTYTTANWLTYYNEMGNYLQSLGPALQVIHSINAAQSPTTGTTDYSVPVTEASDAVGWANRYGWRDGFGSQGLSAQDYLSCSSGGCPVSTCVSPTTCSASNWYPLFSTYGSLGVPLELQPIALSYPNDTNCTNGCSPSTYSGDLQTFLWPFAINQGGTDFEIYWRDLSLAYDVNNYCQLTGLPPACTTSGTSITLGGQIPDPTHLLDFFQATGQGDKNPYCSGNLPQGGAKGNCGYQNNIDAAHGQH
jgi:hypothetical protein